MQIREERPRAVLTNELQRGIVDDVLRVSLARIAAAVARQRHFLAVADQIRRKERVRMDLIVVAKKHVKTVLLRHARRVSAATTPLAKAARSVAALLQHRSDRLFLGPQWRTAAVQPHRRVPAVFAGHEAAPRRGTDRGAGDHVSKDDALLGQPIDVRRANVSVAHERRLKIAQLVVHDIDHVWPLVGGLGNRAETEQRRKAEAVHRQFLVVWVSRS